MRELTRLEQLEYLIGFLKEQKAQIEYDLAQVENERKLILEKKEDKYGKYRNN